MRIRKKFLFIVFSFSVLFYSFINIFKTGINWDSVFDLSAANYTKQIENMTSLSEAYDKVPLTSEFYGIFIYQLSDLLHKIIYFERLDFTNPTLSTYRFINATSFSLSLTSIIIMAGTIYKISKSQRLASIFFIISITAPGWIGMSQVNTKDIPFAAGLTILTSGLMIFINSSPIMKNFFYAILLSASGSFIAVGTRAGGFIFVVSFLMISFLLFLMKNRNRSNFFQFIKTSLLYIIFTLGALLTLLYITNPFARIDLFTWLNDAFFVSGEFPSIQPVKALGQDFLSDQLPYWYIPAWIFAQLPIFLFMMLLIGVAQVLYLIIIKKNIKLFYFMALIFTQGILFPILFSIQNINMYNGIRHVYFIFPALFLLASFPLSNDTTFLKKTGKSFLHLNTFATLLICFNLFALIRWMPYSYAYINPIAGLGQSRNWDLDYWGVTAIEGVTKLRNDTGIQKIVVMPDISSSIPVNSHPAEDFLKSDPKFGLYVFIHWNHKILKETCDIRFYIERDNQTLGMGGICPKK